MSFWAEITDTLLLEVHKGLTNLGTSQTQEEE